LNNDNDGFLDILFTNGARISSQGAHRGIALTAARLVRERGT